MTVDISRPNGKNANFANLKCCLPNGIPIIVMHNRIPKSRCATHVANPPNIHQIMFIGRLMQPMSLELSLTLAPNGQRHNSPSFIVCIPNGMPIMVTINAKEPAKYPMAHSSPPKMSQSKLPINFISNRLN